MNKLKKLGYNWLKKLGYNCKGERYCKDLYICKNCKKNNICEDADNKIIACSLFK